jgi:2,4-dienoyl-CoA reductase (NADPH2)
VKAAVPDTTVYLQGSLDAETAERAVTDGVCDAAEITRGQLADADLVSKLQQGQRVRPCIRCNQTCQVRDNRNPIITCVVDPTTGHETDDPDWTAPATRTRSVVVLGAGPAGLETARIAAQRGHTVTVIDTAHTAGGAAALLPHARPFIEWQVAELADAGVQINLSSTSAPEAAVVVQATGSRRRPLEVPVDASARVFDVADVLRGTPLPDGVIALLDPIGGPIAVALAEQLGDRAVLITPDQIAGNELARTGDLAPANTRLAQRNVRIERRSIVRAITAHGVEVDDRFTGERRTIECAAVVDCGFRLPDEAMSGATQVGDCVAPRTILEAVLEARRAALAI